MELSERFSFQVPGAQFSPAFKNKCWDGKKRLLHLGTGQLSYGLHPYIQEFCDKHDYECVYEDPIDVETPFSVDECKRLIAALSLSTMTDEGREDIQPHDYQEKAIIHAIQASRSLLLSPTSSGKSLMIYILLRYYLAKTKGKILVVVPNTLLVQQLHDDFVDYAAKTSWEADDHIHMLFDGSDKFTDKRIIISTWQSLAVKERLPKEQRARMTAREIKKWNESAEHILDDSYFQEFSVVFGDECHLFAAAELQDIMAKLTNARYRFGTTGTLKDCKAHHMVLEGLFGKVYQTTTTRELMDQKKVADLLIECLQLQYSDAERKFIRKKKTYPEEMDFLLAHPARSRFIRNLALSVAGNTLVLFERVEKHGAILYDMIQKKAISGRKVFFVHGKTETDARNDIRKIVEKETNAIIVASYGTFSTGVSIRNIDNLIFASPTKAKIRVLQSIGRGLRLSKRKTKVTLFDVADDLSSWNKAGTELKDNYSLQHFTERVNYYNAEQFTYKLRKIQLEAT